MEEIQLVTFKIGDEEYGINISLVREIIKTIEITPVPKSPHFVSGLINLRGIIVPVIDLRKLFDIDSCGDKDKNRIIVVEVNDRTLGITVDTVSEVRNLNTSDIVSVPPTVSIIDHKYLDGVGKIGEHILILLKLEKILNSENLMVVDNVQIQ